jgi:hypothetical protein
MQHLPLHVPISAMDDFEPYVILKAVRTLAYLENVVDKVFNTISNRIHDEHNNISSLSNRITQCQESITHLNDSSKVISIFSPLKFVGSENPSPYHPISQFIPESSPEIVSAQSVIITEAPSNTTYDEDLQFKFENAPIVEINQLHRPGLGRSPEYIHSASSLLLFHTHENPYRDTIGTSNFRQSKQNTEFSSSISHSDAPSSIMGHEYLPDIGGGFYGFRPDSSVIPVLDLPNNIPELENIADLGIKLNFELQSISTESFYGDSFFNVPIPNQSSERGNNSTQNTLSFQNSPIDESSSAPLLPSSQSFLPPHPSSLSSSLLASPPPSSSLSNPFPPPSSSFSNPSPQPSLPSSLPASPPPSPPLSLPPPSLAQNPASSQSSQSYSSKPPSLHPESSLNKDESSTRESFLNLIINPPIKLKKITKDEIGVPKQQPEIPSFPDKLSATLYERRLFMSGKIEPVPQINIPSEQQLKIIRLPDGREFVLKDESSSSESSESDTSDDESF